MRLVGRSRDATRYGQTSLTSGIFRPDRTKFAPIRAGTHPKSPRIQRRPHLGRQQEEETRRRTEPAQLRSTSIRQSRRRPERNVWTAAAESQKPLLFTSTRKEGNSWRTTRKALKVGSLPCLALPLEGVRLGAELHGRHPGGRPATRPFSSSSSSSCSRAQKGR